MSLLTSQVPEIEVLSTLLPAYEFEQLIASGSTSFVFKARQRSLDRNVAIKILPSSSIGDARLTESFLDHAKAMAKLTHPNLVRVFDSGEVNGMFYIAMEYVHGWSLHKSAKGQAIEPRQAVKIICQICNGLQFAQQNGVNISTIDSSKVLLNQECEPKIGSFGASSRQSFSSQDHLSEVTDEAERLLVYSVGKTLCELLTGSPVEMFVSGESTIQNSRLAAIVKKAVNAHRAVELSDISSLRDELENWLNAASSRILLNDNTRPTAKKATIRKDLVQKNSFQNLPERAKAQTATRPALWSNIGKCAVIILLLCTIHLLWGAYQTKKESIAKIQETNRTQAPVVKIIEVNRGTPSKPSDTTKVQRFRAEEAEALVSTR